MRSATKQAAFSLGCAAAAGLLLGLALTTEPEIVTETVTQTVTEEVEVPTLAEPCAAALQTADEMLALHSDIRENYRTAINEIYYRNTDGINAVTEELEPMLEQYQSAYLDWVLDTGDCDAFYGDQQ